MYVAAAKATGYDPKSLRNYRYVASRVSVSLRKDNLTFGHHALVASLDADSQSYWLDRAVHDRLSVEDLRSELRAERRGELGTPHRAPVARAPRESRDDDLPELWGQGSRVSGGTRVIRSSCREHMSRVGSDVNRRGGGGGVGGM